MNKIGWGELWYNCLRHLPWPQMSIHPVHAVLLWDGKCHCQTAARCLLKVWVAKQSPFRPGWSIPSVKDEDVPKYLSLFASGTSVAETIWRGWCVSPPQLPRSYRTTPKEQFFIQQTLNITASPWLPKFTSTLFTWTYFRARDPVCSLHRQNTIEDEHRTAQKAAHMGKKLNFCLKAANLSTV